MSGAPDRSSADRISSGALAVVAAGFVVTAAFVMFSAFMYYDDEGYVLLSLRNYAQHGGLYRDVYTQYGPFPFVVYHAIQATGLTLTHTAGRLITLAAWAGTAMAGATLAADATRRTLPRLAALAGIFVYLWVMASEPTHPGGMTVFLTALLAVLGNRLLQAGRSGAWGALAGGIVAALFLTKINIGVFAAFSVGAWWLLHHRHDGVRRWAPVMVSVAAVAMPFALMRPLLGQPWVLDYALAFAGAGLAAVLATAAGARGRVGGRELSAGLLSALAVSAIVVGAVLVRGTSLRELLDGVLLGPLRHPGNFSLRYAWPDGIRAIVAVSTLGAIAAFLARSRAPEGVARGVAIARLVAVALMAAAFARYPVAAPDYSIFGYTLPCLWLFLWPLSREPAAASGAGVWTGWILLGQCLHAFPVPGSQLAWGSVLVVPLAAIGAWEAAAFLKASFAVSPPAARRVGVASGVAVLALVAVLAARFVSVGTRFREGQNLGLPGAELIRLPDRSAGLFRVITLNALAHADVLFSLPGMFSLNLWTDLPTPTHANVTHWFSLLDNTRQQAIVDALSAAPRACVVIDRGHVKFLRERGLAPKGKLFAYLESEFEPAFTVDQFEFCVHRGRRIEPFLLGELRVRAEAAVPAAESTLLTISLIASPRRPIARVEIADGDGHPPTILTAANARIELTPLNARGSPTGGPTASAWPLTTEGPVRVDLYFNRETLPSLASEGTIVLRDPSGNEMGLGRLRRLGPDPSK